MYKLKLANNKVFDIEYFYQMTSGQGVPEITFDIVNSNYKDIIENFISSNLTKLVIYTEESRLGEVILEGSPEIQEVEQTIVLEVSDYTKPLQISNCMEKEEGYFKVWLSQPQLQNSLNDICKELHGELGMETRVAQLEKSVLQLMLMKGAK